MSIARRLLGHVPVNIAQALAGFVAVAAYTRLLSPEDYGRYALALSAGMLTHTLLFTWAEAAAFRFYATAKAEGRLQRHFATLLAIALGALFGLCALAAFLWATPGFAAGEKLLAGAVLGFIAARFLGRLGRETDRAAHQVARYSVWEIAFVLGGLGAGVALAFATPLGPAAPFFGLMAVGLPIAVLDVRRLAQQAGRARPCLAAGRLYFAYGAPLALALALELAVQAGARFIIAARLEAAAVGAFAAAFGLARLLDLVFVWAAMAGGPLLLSAYEAGGQGGAAQAARSYVRVLMGLSLPAALGLCLVAEPLSHTLVGPALAPQTAALLPFMALAGLCGGWLTYYWSEAFQLTRRTGRRALLMLGPGLLTLAMVWLGAGAFGLQGAAIAVAAGAFLGMALLALFGRRLVPLPFPAGDLWRTTLACAAMVPAVLAVPAFGGLAELFAKAAAGAVVYAAAAWTLDVGGVRAVIRAGRLDLFNRPARP